MEGMREDNMHEIMQDFDSACARERLADYPARFNRCAMGARKR